MWLRSVLVLAAFCAVGCRSDAVPSPTAPVLYTATDSVRALFAAPDGSLWAATGGGLLCWRPGQSLPRRWTVADGLPGSDVRAVRWGSEGVEVETAGGRCVITPAGRVEPAPPGPAAPRECAAGPYRADALGFWRRTNGEWRPVALPPGSPASNVSALCPDGSGALAALYGDGIYHLSGARWTRLPDLPPACRFAVALCQTPAGLAVGTQSAGVWRQSHGRWAALAAPFCLPDADIQTLAAFDGALWAGTLDHGLLRIDGDSVRTFSHLDGLRADSPRGMVVFQNRLYVRYATGALDVFDGQRWRPAFSPSAPPRPQVYALATDGRRLLVGGWAGWAAWDGQTWEMHYKDPELAGQVITAIGADVAGTVWLGTQKQGIFRWNNGTYEHDHEAQGLTDDWATCFNLDEKAPLVGTYAGGLLERKSGGRYAVTLHPEKFAVRSVVHWADGRAVAATPLGIFVQNGKTWTLLAPTQTGGQEAQAILPTPTGLWVGTRTGLAFVTNQERASVSASVPAIGARH